ncbi:UNVERIFIED_CONTAM: hypothetical protein FKN15_032505 [Acipenser sinensis]
MRPRVVGVQLLRGTISHTKLSNNRSVMSLHIRGCMRTTLNGSLRVCSSATGMGNRD